jgi:mannose-1-phosphate guanylyltransferase
MIVVIIAGGSGTRLWPLSTSDYPKQLLALAGEKTMVQNTYHRASMMSDKVYVVPDISHAHHIKEQLPELDEDRFIVEPGRRGTANCIVAALAHISKRHDKDEAIVFLSADHHIRDTEGFVKSFILAGEMSTKYKEIALIGIEPTYPATGFGYIERDDEIEGQVNVHKVHSFKEKPDFNTAKQYIAAGRYLWNCGYFVGSVNTFLREMEESAPELKENYEKLLAIDDTNSEDYKETYLSFENEVIDRALIEKAKNLAVVSASFDWMDLGSFKDLHTANESDEKGNHVRGDNVHPEEVENAYIRNEEDKPVIVIGLDNVAIVNTPAGVLVARKDLSQKVGDIVKQMNAKQEK